MGFSDPNALMVRVQLFNGSMVDEFIGLCRSPGLIKSSLGGSAPAVLLMGIWIMCSAAFNFFFFFTFFFPHPLTPLRRQSNRIWRQDSDTKSKKECILAPLFPPWSIKVQSYLALCSRFPSPQSTFPFSIPCLASMSYCLQRRASGY